MNVYSGRSGQEQPQASQMEASPTVRFRVQVLMIGIAYPMLYFVSLLILQIDAMPTWCLATYYWTSILVGASAFGNSILWACHEDGPPYCASLLVMLTMIVVQVHIARQVSGTLSQTWATIVPVLACFYWPALWRCACRKHGGLKAGVFWLAAMTFGAVPCALATGAQVLTMHYGLQNNERLVAPLLVVWTLMPDLMKILGKPLLARGAPASPAMIPVIWVNYIEVIFACLGLSIFSNASVSAMGYALSFLGRLVCLYARGTRLGFRCLPCMGSLGLHRLIILLESFAALMGRLSSYTLLLCFSVLHTIRGEERDATGAHFGHRKMDLFAGQKVGAVSILMGVLCTAVTVATFTAFAWLLPKIWLPEAPDGRQDGDAGAPSAEPGPPGELYREAWSPDSTDGAAESPPAGPGPADPPPSGQRSWIEESSPSVKDASPFSAHVMQNRLMTAFMVEHRLQLVSMLVFAFQMCIVLAGLASFIDTGLRLEKAGDQ